MCIVNEVICCCLYPRTSFPVQVLLVTKRKPDLSELWRPLNARRLRKNGGKLRFVSSWVMSIPCMPKTCYTKLSHFVPYNYLAKCRSFKLRNTQNWCFGCLCCTQLPITTMNEVVVVHSLVFSGFRINFYEIQAFYFVGFRVLYRSYMNLRRLSCRSSLIAMRTRGTRYVGHGSREKAEV